MLTVPPVDARALAAQILGEWPYATVLEVAGALRSMCPCGACDPRAALALDSWLNDPTHAGYLRHEPACVLTGCTCTPGATPVRYRANRRRNRRTTGVTTWAVIDTAEAGQLIGQPYTGADAEAIAKQYAAALDRGAPAAPPT